jgi:opacity protein-like surface antigen
MKKVIVVFLLSVLSVPYLAAQNENSHKGESEVSANIAFVSTTKMLAVLSNIVGSVVTFGIYSPANIKNSPDIGVAYRYYLSNRFALGGSFMYMNNRYDATFINFQDGRDVAGTGIIHFFKISAEAKLDYYRSEWFSCYGFLGLGIDIINNRYTPSKNANAVSEGEDEETKNLIRSPNSSVFPFPNAHICPIGISVGKAFGGFAELGFGYKGVINVGLYGRF